MGWMPKIPQPIAGALFGAALIIAAAAIPVWFGIQSLNFFGESTIPVGPLLVVAALLVAMGYWASRRPA